MNNQSPGLRWIRVAAADRCRVWLGIPRDEKWKWIILQRAVIEVTNRLGDRIWFGQCGRSTISEIRRY